MESSAYYPENDVDTAHQWVTLRTIPLCVVSHVSDNIENASALDQFEEMCWKVLHFSQVGASFPKLLFKLAS